MPGFYLYTSNRAESLADCLAGTLSGSGGSVFEAEKIIVQSRGMERWLQFSLADRLGICANIDFPFPRSFIYDSLFAKVSDCPELSPYDPRIMSWNLMRILPECFHDSAFEPLKSYLKEDVSGLKLFQLSGKIAMLFDQYLIYRPDWLSSWERGIQVFPGNEHAAWQSKLWNLYRQELSLDTPTPLELRKLLLDDLERVSSELPAEISLFGISTLPPFYMEIFRDLSRFIRVNFFYLSPCREFWEDIRTEGQILDFSGPEEEGYFETGNDLLASLGGTGRQFFKLLNNYDFYPDLSDDYHEPSDGNTLLGAIQADILNLKNRGRDCPPLPFSEKDRSLRIHSCHSPVREVEVLYDNLLDVFNENPGMRPDDIVVMTPEISIYAPFIQAVFANPENPARRIPFSIADRSFRQDNSIAEALIRLLALPEIRFTSLELLELLDEKSIRDKFDLSEKNIGQLHCWVKDSGIRWGIDGGFREEAGLPGFEANSWRFGLARMLAGYAMNRNYELFDGICPYDEIEGDGGEVLGNFIVFVELLFEWREKLKKAWTLLEWQEILGTLMETFFKSDESNEQAIQMLRDNLGSNGLGQIASNSIFKGKIPVSVMKSWLAGELSGKTGCGGFIGGGVTFCTMLPMRSIPFKVVCFLGMNDGAYPRQTREMGFDLMENDYRLCDPSRRHEERFLFLEALLSARKRLIISYVGQSIKDGSEMPPSVLVNELSDYLGKAFSVTEDDFLIKHPLQPFSPRYFSGDRELFSFSEENCRAGSGLGMNSDNIREFINLLPESEIKAVTIGELTDFLLNPAKYLLKQRLKINLDGLDRNELPEEKEAFEIETLAGYAMTQELTEFILAGGDVNKFGEILRAEGRLPSGSAERSEFLGLKTEVEAFVGEVQKFLPPEKNSCQYDCSLDLNGVAFSGRFNLWPDFGHVAFRCAKLKVKDLIRCWIVHLALNASGDDWNGDRNSIHIATDKKFAFAPLEQEYARLLLVDLLELFKEGFRCPLPFFPETSYAFAQKDGDRQDRLSAAEKKWSPPNYKTEIPSEFEDLYVKRCFAEDVIYQDGFAELAEKVFKPLLEAGEEGKDV
jgi:exodeoxyribonuclease V gamma subunit